MLPTLRNKDGFRNTTPALMPAVEKLQRALKRAGYSVSTDGLFGENTRAVVLVFQEANGLTADGIVGPATWRALEPFLRPSERNIDTREVNGFETFHGDLAWVHKREGHVGKPYWPGGQSGVTFDPGFDLGYQSRERVETLFGSLLSAVQLRATSGVLGKKGVAAQNALNADQTLLSIRISRSQALQIMPEIAVSYWTKISQRFPGLASRDTPPSVQTSMLSLAYNRGAANRRLEPLATPIGSSDWLTVADVIGGMQQNHELPGIRSRRRMEADLIRDELSFT